MLLNTFTVAAGMPMEIWMASPPTSIPAKKQAGHNGIGRIKTR